MQQTLRTSAPCLHRLEWKPKGPWVAQDSARTTVSFVIVLLHAVSGTLLFKSFRSTSAGSIFLDEFNKEMPDIVFCLSSDLIGQILGRSDGLFTCTTAFLYPPAHCTSHVGVGKEKRTLIGPWLNTKRNLPLIELPRELLALCWRILRSERHRDELRSLIKLGTITMVHDGSHENRSGKREKGAESRKLAPDFAWV